MFGGLTAVATREPKPPPAQLKRTSDLRVINLLERGVSFFECVPGSQQVTPVEVDVSQLAIAKGYPAPIKVVVLESPRPLVRRNGPVCIAFSIALCVPIT
jgi:hypothetical protein